MVQADGDVDALATVSEVAQKAAYGVDLSNVDVVDQATVDVVDQATADGVDQATAAGVDLPNVDVVQATADGVDQTNVGVDQATADAGGDLTTAVAGVVLPDAVAD